MGGENKFSTKNEAMPAEFELVSRSPSFLLITDPDDQQVRKHALSLNVLNVMKVGTDAGGQPQYNVQVNFAITLLNNT